MIGSIFWYSLFFYMLVLAISIYYKRTWSISYDRKSLFSNTLAFVFVSIAYFFLGLDFTSIKSLSVPNKVFSAVTIVLLANGVVQFAFWLMYTIIRYKGWVKMPRFLFNIIAFFILIGVILASIKFIFDQELTGLLVTSTVVSAIIGLALQDTLSNLFSGISLQIETPFNIDDWVNLGGFEGKVVSQNWRSVTLLTRENHRVSLTNRFVAEDKIVNFSRPTRRQIHNFYIELDYSHPPNHVKKILRDLLNEIDEVELDESHGAFVLDYMESGIKYCLRYWLYDYGDILHIQDVVLSRLWYTLKRNDLKIPYPTREIQMQMVPEAVHGNAEAENSSVVKFLSHLEWLKEMDDAKIKKLADKCRMKLYAKDDLIVRQGEEGNSMFIILEGSIRVMVKSDTQVELDIAQKSTGEFFGEMSLLTGEPRTASIRAQEDSRILVIDKDSFSTLVISDERILSQFVDVLGKCKSGIADAIEKERENSNITNESAHRIIFNKIWNYLRVA